MVEYLEKLPKNKFRKIAAKDLETIYIEINEVRNKKVKMINTLKINCEDWKCENCEKTLHIVKNETKL